MAILQPDDSTQLFSVHSMLHRIFAADESAPVKKVVVDKDGNIYLGDYDGGNYVKILTNGNVVFVGAAGLPYGCVFSHNIADVVESVAVNDWDQIVGFTTNGESKNTIPDQVNNNIKITKAGVYRLHFSWSGFGPNVVHDWDFHLAKNNNDVSFPNTTAHISSPSTQKIVSVANDALVSLEVDDTIELWVQRITPGNNIDLTTIAANISMEQLGG